MQFGLQRTEKHFLTYQLGRLSRLLQNLTLIRVFSKIITRVNNKLLG